MALCTQLTFPSSSKAASQDFLGPPFQLPHAAPSSSSSAQWCQGHLLDAQLQTHIASQRCCSPNPGRVRHLLAVHKTSYLKRRRKTKPLKTTWNLQLRWGLNFDPVESSQPLYKMGFEIYRSEETQRNCVSLSLHSNPRTSDPGLANSSPPRCPQCEFMCLD